MFSVVNSDGRQWAVEHLHAISSDQRRIHGGGARGAIAPPRLGPKKIIARPKNTHICKPPFACQNVLKLKTHLQQSRISKFSGEDPRTPSSREGEGRGRKGGEGGEREGKEEGKG